MRNIAKFPQGWALGRARLGLVAFVLALSSFSLVQCAKQTSGPQATEFADRVDDNVGCSSFEDEFWNGLHKISIDKSRLPSTAEMKTQFERSLSSGRLQDLPEADRGRIVAALTELFDTIANEALTTLAVDPSESYQVLSAIAALEIGDAETPEKQMLQAKLREKFAEIDRLASTVVGPRAVALCKRGGGDDPVPAPNEKAQTLLSMWKATRHPAVYGGLKALATSYQSCEAGLVGALSSSTPDIEGIKVTGMHPDGVGKKRVIGDLAAFLAKHPYLTDYRKPASSCFGVTAKPMIYDYGGKPDTTSDVDSALNFFVNNGSGTSALGIDCSGYVYSALATAGLKVKKSGRLKAVSVHGIPARMYMNPAANGMDCLAFAKFEGLTSLKPGDILASKGHVILIESVGQDPFGIAWITTESQCVKANIAVSRFNFTLLQSSPVKGGVGIDLMQASEFFSEAGSMTDGIYDHAINACKAHVQKAALATKSATTGLVRHLGTAECKDRPLRLSREECVSQCPASLSGASMLATDGSAEQTQNQTVRPLSRR